MVFRYENTDYEHVWRIRHSIVGRCSPGYGELLRNFEYYTLSEKKEGKNKDADRFLFPVLGHCVARYWELPDVYCLLDEYPQPNQIPLHHHPPATQVGTTRIVNGVESPGNPRSTSSPICVPFTTSGLA